MQFIRICALMSALDDRKQSTLILALYTACHLYILFTCITMYFHTCTKIRTCIPSLVCIYYFFENMIHAYERGSTYENTYMYSLYILYFPYTIRKYVHVFPLSYAYIIFSY